MRAVIEGAGFRARVGGRDRARSRGPSTGGRRCPPHSIQRLVMGDAIDAIIAAGHRNRAEGRIVVDPGGLRAAVTALDNARPAG